MCYLAQPYRLLRMSPGTWNCSTSCLSLSQAISNLYDNSLNEMFLPSTYCQGPYRMDFFLFLKFLKTTVTCGCGCAFGILTMSARELNFAVPAFTHKIRLRNIKLRKTHRTSFLGPLFFPSPGAEGNGEERLLEWSWVTCTSWWIQWKTAVSASSRNSGNSLKIGSRNLLVALGNSLRPRRAWQPKRI